MKKKKTKNMNKDKVNRDKDHMNKDNEHANQEKEHMNKEEEHMNKDRVNLDCILCRKPFTSLFNLNRHVQNIHERPNRKRKLPN